MWFFIPKITYSAVPQGDAFLIKIKDFNQEKVWKRPVLFHGAVSMAWGGKKRNHRQSCRREISGTILFFPAYRLTQPAALGDALAYPFARGAKERAGFWAGTCPLQFLLFQADKHEDVIISHCFRDFHSRDFKRESVSDLLIWRFCLWFWRYSDGVTPYFSLKRREKLA